MKIFFKRVGAYLLDLIIIWAVVSLLSYLPFLNPNRSQYTEKFRELAMVTERLQNNEISMEEYEQAAIPIEYELDRLNTWYVVINLVCVLLYFGLFQYYMNGQTIGKKLFKIKVTSKDESNLSLLNYMLRTVVVSNMLITIALQIIVFVMDANTYYPIYRNVNLVGSTILYMTIFMVLVRVDGRGLHDMVAGTKVEEIIEQPKEENVIEIEEPKKKEVKKTAAKKKTSTTKTKKKTQK